MLLIESWLWILAVLSALVMSIGFSIFTLSTSQDMRGEALLMLPLELLPNSPPSPVSKIFLFMFGLAFVAFFGALVTLLFFMPWGYVIAGGIVLFFAKGSFQRWWIRSSECRPMKPMLIWSAILVLAFVVAVADIAIQRL